MVDIAASVASTWQQFTADRWRFQLRFSLACCSRFVTREPNFANRILSETFAQSFLSAIGQNVLPREEINMMLKGIPEFMDPELLWTLASMGHGDEIAVVDRNFSGRRVAAATTTGKLIVLSGIDAPTAIGGILELMPLDDFADTPIMHMGPIDDPERLLAVHRQVIDVCARAENRPVRSRAVERMAYYPIAMACFAVIQTSEERPYANFILKKGVVNQKVATRTPLV